MPDYKKPVHKVAPGDNLTKIAKKYGHKKWQTIWKAPENKKLVSKRKDPENIQPGDTIVIPFNEQQQSEIAQEAFECNSTLHIEFEFRKALEGRRKGLETSIANLKRTMQESDALHKRIVVDLDAAAKGAKSWGATVDAIATVATLMTGLTKLASKGHKASKASGELLEKLNKEMQKDALDMAYGPIKSEVRKAAAKHVTDEKNGYDHAIAAVGIVSESFDKMTSPSFWAWTVVRLKEGDSWSDAVTHDFQKEVKQKIAGLVRDHAKSQARLKKSIQEKQGLIKDIKRDLEASKKRESAAKDRLKVLEKL